MKLNWIGWLIVLGIIGFVFLFWSAFVYVTIKPIETFKSKSFTLRSLRSHSFDLFNPSPYSGYFSHRFREPAFHTRTNYTIPITLPSQRLYSLSPHQDSIFRRRKSLHDWSGKLRPIMWTPWTAQDVVPIKGRRHILV